MRVKYCVAILIALLLPVGATLGAADLPKATAEHWEIAGDFSEACTCAVPCTCNFGAGPSPKHYCWSMFSLDIQKGHYGGTDLAGLRLAGIHGKTSAVWYVDDRATPEQAEALKVIASHLGHRKRPVHYQTAHILQDVGDKANSVKIADKGGFDADYIIGLDGKTPVIVENNTSWNIQHAIKAKTSRLHYKDEFGNKYDVKNSNSNQGKFDWTDQTPKYF